MKHSDKLEGVRAFGIIFNKNNNLGSTIPSPSYDKCTIVAQNAVILVIPHSNHDLNAIERDILMTTREKSKAFGKFSILKEIENF